MNIKFFLYDADGKDSEIEWEKFESISLSEKNLLWIDVSERDEESVAAICNELKLENVPLRTIINANKRPIIEIFEDFFYFSLSSVDSGGGKLKQIPLDVMVGHNVVITIHDGEVAYFKEFVNQKKGETYMGALDAESFVATLLDLHILSYFRAMEMIDEEVGKLDERILQSDLEAQDFLSKMIELRRQVTYLRRWFLPQREVFYAFKRPDFKQISESDSAKHFEHITEHFENAFDSIESSRDTVLSLFDLYATRTSQMTNDVVQKLTFITLILGIMGVVAGVMGMNYKEDFFDNPSGFWITLGGMVVVAIALTIIAKYKKWI